VVEAVVDGEVADEGGDADQELRVVVGGGEVMTWVLGQGGGERAFELRAEVQPAGEVAGEGSGAGGGVG